MRNSKGILTQTQKLASLLCLLFSLSIYPAETGIITQNLFFNHLTVNNGLSQNSITSILQDSQGLIWIGSYDGLNRFDGFSTRILRHDPNDSNSLTENRILCFTENKEGDLWIGTEGGGINVYNPYRETFRHYNRENGMLTDNTIVSICSDYTGNIWIGTESCLSVAGKDDRDSLCFDHIESYGSIFNLCHDKNNTVWFACPEGLFIVEKSENPTSEKWETKQVKEFPKETIYSLFCDSFNSLWVSTIDSLYVVNRKEPGIFEVTNIQETIFKEESLNVRAVTEDSEGNIWLGTDKSGLYKVCFNPGRVYRETACYRKEIPFCNILDNNIRTLFRDKTDVLWIGFHKKRGRLCRST